MKNTSLKYFFQEDTYLKNFEVYPFCECGDNYHSLEHIFWDCKNFAVGRQTSFSG